MGWTITGSMAFTAFAAIVQLTIGGLMLLRNPRNERVALFGLLFLLNGLAAAATFAAAGFPEIRDQVVGNAGRLAGTFSRMALLTEMATNLLVLLLAIIYPRRPKWLRKAPHVVILFAGLAALLLMVRAYGEGYLLPGRAVRTTLSAPVVLIAYGVFDLAFPILLLRWSAAWSQQMSPELRSQFGLVFAAFGVRAVHQMVFVPYVEIDDLARRESTTAGLVLGGIIVAVIAAALLITLWRLLRARDRWTWFVLAFLGFGLLEGVLNIFLNRGLDLGWWHALTGDFDVLVIRPVLLWFAVTRTQFLDIRLRSGAFAWVIAFVLAAASVMGGVFEAFGDRGDAAVQWTLSALIGVAVASAVVAGGRSLAATRAFWVRSPSGLEAYAIHLEEAYRNGQPDLVEEARLARLRRHWSISDQLHDELTARVQGQKATSTSG